MKTYSSRQLTAQVAGLLTVLTTILILITWWFNPGIFIIILFIILFFVAAYFYVMYIVNRYIWDKIRPVYKTIKDLPLSGKKLAEKSSDSNNLLSNVKFEVEEWAKTQLKEIERLKELERYRKEFVGNVSHELKTPIFNIQGYILTLLEGGIDDPEINMLYLKRTERSIDRMISIIEDLESISKLESGEMVLNPSRFNIFQLTEEVFDLQEVRADKRNIKLKFGRNIDRNIFVMADKPRIFQVLSNLVVNSINYGKEGGTTTVNFYDMDNLVLIEVKDNGIGIASKDLPRIFERFYRVDKSRSREQGGTGLGLAIVKHIIEAHNQTINVNSKPGKGSSFTFTLEKAR